MRLTFDFDNALSLGNLANIVIADRFLKRISYKREYYVSARKKGMHCIYWVSDKKFKKYLGKNLEITAAIRYIFNDDPQRILLDILRARTGDVTDVLWDEKGKEKNRQFKNIWDCFKYIDSQK